MCWPIGSYFETAGASLGDAIRLLLASPACKVEHLDHDHDRDRQELETDFDEIIRGSQGGRDKGKATSGPEPMFGWLVSGTSTGISTNADLIFQLYHRTRRSVRKPS